MKKIYILIIMIFVISMSNQKLSSTEPDALMGDFGIIGASGYDITATIEIVSVPFEGITEPRPAYGYPVNRVGQIQNGIYWRFLGTPPFQPIQNNMAYMSRTMNVNGNIFDIGHCSGSEFPLPNDNLSWGFAKYKITISVAYPNEKYQFYINSLDSKYGRTNTGGYSRDLQIEYLPNNPANRKIVFSKIHVGIGKTVIDTVATWDTLANGKPSKEYKLWKVILNQDNPMEKNFYARTTPFPISPRVIKDYHIRELDLGTKVIFDTVYNYTGLSDIYGYNTIDSAGVFYPYFTNPPIPTGNSVKNTFVTPAYFYNDNNNIEIVGLKINVLPGDTIILKPDKRFWISGYNPNSDNGDTLLLSAGSVVTKEIGAQLNTCYGGTILDYGATLNWSPNSFSHIFSRSELSNLGTSHIINNSGHVEIDAYARLKVGDNTTVTFDGAGTYLKLNPNAIVQLGQNAKIIFKNGAYINANGATFSGINNAVWSGIVLENSGDDAINNCIFDDANTPIKITNTVSPGAYSNKIIKNNHFNYPASNCIFGENIKVLLFEGNTINMNSANIGLLIKNYYQILPEHESQSTFDNVIIKNNVFNNGGISMALACYTNGFTTFQVLNNTFNGSNVGINFVGRLMGGSISGNHTESSPTLNRCMQFTQSNLDLYGNNLSSNYLTIYNYFSTLNMAPLQIDGNFVWTGGHNYISSTQGDNINFVGGIAYLEDGQNCFYKQESLQYHLIGFINSTNNEYKVRSNGFNGTPNPAASLIDVVTGQPVVIIPGINNYECNTTASGESWIVRDLGNGVFDSTMVTANNEEPEPSADEILYSLAEQNKDSDNYTQAIDYFITLINNHPSSSYLNTSLYDLYGCYEGLDTSGSQSHRNLIYGYLKTYLDDKILSGLYDAEFNDIAYNITLMCLIKIKEYQNAEAGYEFISLYHPDPYLRLLASWDYAEIENLILNAGGESSKNELMSDDQYIKTLHRKLKGLIPKDPVLDKVKKSYDKKKKEKYDKVEKEFNKALDNREEIAGKIASLKSEEQKMDIKVATVLRSANNLSADDRIKKQIEDLVLPSMSKSNNQKQVSNIIPEKYALSQNYPNPFNPNTTIRYSMPKNGMVSLKVYDVTGREIKTLVNEVKTAGSYSVDFNGSGIASGVYFYKLQSGDFISVKRMVLVK